MLRISHDLKGTAAEELRAHTALLRNVKAVVRAVSFATERRVKTRMPVDTGRARASWGHWTDNLTRPNPQANPDDAAWKEEDDGLSIEQGSNVEYIDRLNAGHSKQAPAGFIDLAAEEGMNELERRVEEIMRAW